MRLVDGSGGDPGVLHVGTTGNAVAAPEAARSTRLAALLAMAMFVLVVDTSLMNVSISYVVHDLHATASGVTTRCRSH